jgi:ABC-type branched-subunit amino acid transport system substrate-binding protein
VTKDGTKCTTYADCLAIIKGSGDPDYDGASGPISMNGNGEPLEASYGVLQFGAGNQIDDSLTTYIGATAPESAAKPLTKTDVTRAGDGTLKLGGLLPQTGSLAFLGPPEFAGLELAIADINAAGGALGKPVEYSPGDSGDTSTDTASQTADRLLGEGVDAIIGAASSSVTLTVIDKITAAGVVQFSPANTSLKLVDYPDHSLYFRDAPPDDLQGNVIAQLVIDDGNQSAYILALDDAYGTSLQGVIEGALKAGGVEVLGSKIYDPKATSFDAEVDGVAAADPDAIIVISFDEGSRILKTMVEKGIGPSAKKVYGCDGNIGNALGDNFNAGK